MGQREAVSKNVVRDVGGHDRPSDGWCQGEAADPGPFSYEAWVVTQGRDCDPHAGPVGRRGTWVCGDQFGEP